MVLQIQSIEFGKLVCNCIATVEWVLIVRRNICESFLLSEEINTSDVILMMILWYLEIKAL